MGISIVFFQYSLLVFLLVFIFFFFFYGEESMGEGQSVVQLKTLFEPSLPRFPSLTQGKE